MTVRQWIGVTGSANVKRVDMQISDTSGDHVSPYAKFARNGATLFPRVLFFVEEMPNPATVSVGNTITTNPRRGVYDKEPWKSLDLPSLNANTIEREHLYDAHLGETLVPYATLEPLKVILPARTGSTRVEHDPGSPNGIATSAMERRMRSRWNEINRAWEENKRPGYQLTLVRQLDYYGKLSSQMAWQQDFDGKPIRIAYAGSGTPTATVIEHDQSIVDYTLFWLNCESFDEAHYLTAIINSNLLFEQLKPLMPKGQFGARHVQKHLWRLPIPEYDVSDSTHVAISDAGRQAALGVERELGNLRQRYARLTVTIARREIRKWLRESVEGQRVEEVVGVLLGG